MKPRKTRNKKNLKKNHPKTDTYLRFFHQAHSTFPHWHHMIILFSFKKQKNKHVLIFYNLIIIYRVDTHTLYTLTCNKYK